MIIQNDIVAHILLHLWQLPSQLPVRIFWFRTLFEAKALVFPPHLKGQIQWWLRSVIIGLRTLCKDPVADDSGKGPVASHGVARPVAVAAGGGNAWPVGGSLQQKCK